MTDYALLAAQARALCEGCPSWVSALANASALVMESMDDVSWAGFYLVDQDDPTRLLLGPFQGKVACVEIARGKGVCGTAWELDQTQLVPDVHAFPGHIACDSASRSEVVVPIHAGGRVVAVLDLDSTSPARFLEEDARGLEGLVAALEEVVAW